MNWKSRIWSWKTSGGADMNRIAIEKKVLSENNRIAARLARSA